MPLMAPYLSGYTAWDFQQFVVSLFQIIESAERITQL
jgi:hypothetical protein